MQILLYEHLTGGGSWGLADAAPAASLLAEGEAMVAALAEDLLRIPDTSVVLFRDTRLAVSAPVCRQVQVGSAADEEAALQEWARRADATLLIAPEFDEQLLQRAQLVENCGGRLIGPDSAFVELASDKWRTNRHLSDAGVPVPAAELVTSGRRPPNGPSFPAVLKPRFGAGSGGVRMLREPEALRVRGRDWCLESFQRGLAASVAVLCGPKVRLVLPACRQLLSSDGRFRYRGGETPLATGFDSRACRLAERAMDALPGTTGYVGIDMVLGSAEDGSHDFVIEVNPRLTTSYLGLRRAARGNLAAAILDVALGRSCELSFSDEPIEFSVGD